MNLFTLEWAPSYLFYWKKKHTILYRMYFPLFHGQGKTGVPKCYSAKNVENKIHIK